MTITEGRAEAGRSNDAIRACRLHWTGVSGSDLVTVNSQLGSYKAGGSRLVVVLSDVPVVEVEGWRACLGRVHLKSNRRGWI